MRSVTLAQLMTRVRQRANMENSQFISDSELIDNINESLAELYDLLVGSYGQEYFRKTSPSTSTTASVSDYALPNDFYKVISVDIILSGNQTYSAIPFSEYERNQFKWYPGWGYNTPVLYRLHGSNSTFPSGSISFIPGPTGNFQINYVPSCPKLSDPINDSFDGINGWEEYAVLDAAINCLQKEESDASALEARKGAIRMRIEGMSPRDANAPEKVHDTSLEDFGGWRLM